MNTAKRQRVGIRWVILSIGLLVLGGALAASGEEQESAGKSPAATQVAAAQALVGQEQSQKQEQQQNQKQDQKQAGGGARPTPPPSEVKITPREAEELFHSVDEILAFDSRETGLRVKREVKRRLTSRDEVVSYLTQHMNDEDTQRLRRSELVLKKFGLLPHDFDLQKLMVALLREEVAGYYDPKTKTVNLLEWVPMAEQEPVMAHELTHALQDQAVGLEKWMKKGDKDLGMGKKNPTSADIVNDEIDTVREAVIEGQAQAMAFQYAVAPTGHSIADSPQLLGAMEDETLSGTTETKVFNSAPIFLRESLTFPYSYGLEFVVTLLRKSGKEKAFAGVLHNPPHTTREIMEPEKYLAGEKIEPMRLPDFARDFQEYRKFDIGAMGEFDVAVLIEQYAGREASKRMYPAWRGGYYYAARAKSDAAAPLGLLYVSRWADAEKAAEFAAIYARALGQRYKKVGESGTPGLSNKTEALTGRHSWTTEEGAVVIEAQGDTVLVSESLDAATTQTLEKEVFSMGK